MPSPAVNFDSPLTDISDYIEAASRVPNALLVSLVTKERALSDMAGDESKVHDDRLEALLDEAIARGNRDLYRRGVNTHALSQGCMPIHGGDLMDMNVGGPLEPVL